LGAVFNAARIEDQGGDAPMRPRLGGLEAARHQAMVVGKRHPQARAFMCDAGEAAACDDTGERFEQLRLASRADGDKPVELRLVRAIAA
jgi:hypothetical protein